MAKGIFQEDSGSNARRIMGTSLGVIAALVVAGIGVLWFGYEQFCINVPAQHVAILIHKSGQDLANTDEVAEERNQKGVQRQMLTEGRYLFQYNPVDWDWEIEPLLEIPPGKLGVKINLIGDDLPYGEFLALDAKQKGIVRGVLQPGRYAINKYIERVELHEPRIVPAGFKGVKRNLAGTIPTKPEHYEQDESGLRKELLVKTGYRGVEKETYAPGTYNLNPYEFDLDLVDCRNQRFNVGDVRDLGFPSKDGFWVTLDSIVEFRVKPEMAAQVYVLYNEARSGEGLHEEIVRKIILPAARSFCRLQGSNNAGRDFIEGTARTQFQDAYLKEMKKNCEPLGIEIVQALITGIRPPQQIAKPVRDREIAKQKEEQYRQQIAQQKSEEKLAVEKQMVTQKQALIDAEQEVVQVTTQALREQEVDLTIARQRQGVAKFKLEATKDEAAAITSRGKAAAEVVTLKNQAEAAGWKRSVEAFQGQGALYAQYVLYSKLATSYRSIMVNTADSPIMKIFEKFQDTPKASGSASTPRATATTPRTNP